MIAQTPKPVEKAFFLELIRPLSQKPFKRFFFLCATPLPPYETLCHPPYRLSFSLKGTYHAAAAVDGKIGEHDIIPGDLVFCRRHSWNNEASHKPSAAFSIVFHPDFTRFIYAEREQLDFEYEKLLFYHTQNPATRAEFHLLNAIDALSETDKHPEVIIQDLSLSLLKLVVTSLENDPSDIKSGKSLQTWQLVKHYVCENYQHPINRDEAANVLGLSPSYISQLFQSYSEENFNAFLKRLRIEEAKRLLNMPNMQISEIGRRCGFTNSAYFTRVFKESCGIPPHQFRFKS